MSIVTTNNSKSQLDAFDAEALAIATKLNQRWRAEVQLLAAIAPAPRFRWPLATSLGVTVADFTWPDSNAIGRALRVGHQHGQRIVCLLARDLLIAVGCWDADDLRPFVGSSKWGPGGLAAIFVRSADIRNEAEAITSALAAVRALPAWFEATTRRSEAA
jgi:hypothetical protein